MSAVPQESKLTAHPLRTLLAFSFTNATCWMIALGTPMVLLAGEIGASTVAVGFAYSAVFLLLPVQIIATAYLPRFGFKRQMIFGWTTRSVFLFIPLALAFWPPAVGQTWAIFALLGSVIGFALFRSLGSCAVMPWIYHLVPDEIRGRYFSTDQTLTGVAGVVTLLLCAGLFAVLPVFSAFAWQYTFALLGSALSVALLTSLPDAPKPAATSVGAIARETPAWCFRPSTFRTYLGFMLAANLVMTAFPPFLAYYLKVEVGLSSQKILLFTALQYVGAIGGSLIVRRHVDRLGVKPFFRLGLGGQMVLMVFWFGHLESVPVALALVPMAYLLFGMAIAWWNAAHLKYLPRVCPEENRALAISIHTSVVGILGGLSPILWGLVLRHADGEPGMHLDRFEAYLALSFLIHGMLLFLVPRLTSEGRGLASIPTFGQLGRSFRYLGSLINPLEIRDPRGKGKRPPDERDPPA
jgi:MFS family permease